MDGTEHDTYLGLPCTVDHEQQYAYYVVDQIDSALFADFPFGVTTAHGQVECRLPHYIFPRCSYGYTREARSGAVSKRL